MALESINALAGKIPNGLVIGLDAAIPLQRYTEYQRDYNWNLIMPRSFAGLAGLTISKYCKRVVFGNQNVEKVQFIATEAKRQFVPDGLLINQVQMTFLVPFPDLILDYFVKWRSLAIDKVGNYAPQIAYKHNIFVYLYTQQGITSNILQLKGAFPVRLPAYDLAYANENVLKYDITLSVDDLILKPMNLTGAVGTTIPRVLGRATSLL